MGRFLRTLTCAAALMGATDAHAAGGAPQEFKCKLDGYGFNCSNLAECDRLADAHLCAAHNICGRRNPTEEFRPPRSAGEALFNGVWIWGGIGSLLGSLRYQDSPSYITAGGMMGAGFGVGMATLFWAKEMPPGAAAFSMAAAGAAGAYGISHYRYLEGYEDTRVRDTLIGAAAGAAIGVPLSFLNRTPHMNKPRRGFHRPVFIATPRYIGITWRW